MVKIVTPYGESVQALLPPDTITHQLNAAKGKAKPRYPSGKPTVDVTTGGGKGPMKIRALTPGSSPSGS